MHTTLLFCSCNKSEREPYVKTFTVGLKVSYVTRVGYGLHLPLHNVGTINYTKIAEQSRGTRNKNSVTIRLADIRQEPYFFKKKRGN